MGTASRDHTKSISPARDTRRMRVLLVEYEEPPAEHGFAERGGARILMLTASGTVEDRADGLTLGTPRRKLGAGYRLRS